MTRMWATNPCPMREGETTLQAASAHEVSISFHSRTECPASPAHDELALRRLS